MESTLREYNSLRKRNFGVLSPTLTTPNIRSIKCKQSPVYGIFWPLLPHPSTDRIKTRTWSSLSP